VQRDRLLAKIFPRESAADLPTSRQPLTTSSAVPPILPRATLEPAPGEADLRDVDDDSDPLALADLLSAPPASANRGIIKSVGCVMGTGGLVMSDLVGGEPARIARKEARRRLERIDFKLTAGAVDSSIGEHKSVETDDVDGGSDDALCFQDGE